MRTVGSCMPTTIYAFGGLVAELLQPALCQGQIQRRDDSARILQTACIGQRVGIGPVVVGVSEVL
jgi:hypothetical protein